MERIERKNGYVYLVTGMEGFETYFNMGRDPDSTMWSDDVKPRRRKRKKDEK